MRRRPPRPKVRTVSAAVHRNTAEGARRIRQTRRHGGPTTGTGSNSSSARTDAALAEESEDRLARKIRRRSIVAPVMRVTLLPTPISRSSQQSRRRLRKPGADRRGLLAVDGEAAGEKGGSHDLDRQGRGARTAGRRPRLHRVHETSDLAGSPSRFELRETCGRDSSTRSRARRALATWLGTLFSSWGKTLTALTALIAAAVGLWAAIRKLRKSKK